MGWQLAEQIVRTMELGEYGERCIPAIAAMIRERDEMLARAHALRVLEGPSSARAGKGPKSDSSVSSPAATPLGIPTGMKGPR